MYKCIECNNTKHSNSFYGFPWSDQYYKYNVKSFDYNLDRIKICKECFLIKHSIILCHSCNRFIHVNVAYKPYKLKLCNICNYKKRQIRSAIEFFRRSDINIGSYFHNGKMFIKNLDTNENITDLVYLKSMYSKAKKVFRNKLKEDNHV